jgi:hypothetical protein
MSMKVLLSLRSFGGFLNLNHLSAFLNWSEFYYAAHARRPPPRQQQLEISKP